MEILENNISIPNKLITTDSIFSVEEYICKFNEILTLAEEYDCIIYIYDAHGIGVIGKNDQGIKL